MRIFSFPSLTAGTLLAASLTAMTASAADLPRRAPVTAPAAVYTPVASWTGCYVGGNVGAAWGSRELETSVGTISSSSSSARFAGGGQIGCDYQAGAWVFGIRNMFDWADAERSGTVVGGPFSGYSAKLENNWVDLLTGRIGYAAQPNWLLYFQGGGAWRKNSLTVNDPTGFEVANTNRTQSGWTVGVGTEWKFAPNWSAFVEYNHAEFGNSNATVNGPFGPVAFNGKSDVDMVLFGVNWRWSGGGY